MSGPADLPDINVWLALSIADHPHYQRARSYWYEEPVEQFAFCAVTALGFLRLCTNSVVMGGRPLTVPAAWQAYHAFRRLPEVVLAAEPGGCESVLEAWAREGRFPPGLWTDAYLAAFAVAGGLRLVSFDGGFTRFEGLNFLRLEA